MAVSKAAAERIFGDENGHENENGQAPAREPTNERALQRIARDYVKARDEKDRIDKLAKDAGDKVDTAEASLIDALEASKIKSIRLSNGTLLSLASSDLYTMPAKGDPAYKRVLAWVRRLRGAPKPELSIHPSTFRSFMKERAARGMPIHESVNHLSRKVIQLRRGK